MATIEQLYYCYDVLFQAKDDAGKHTEEFMTIMKGATGETNSKMLTLQFLPKFSKYFPQLLTQAFEYQLDLCEDNDINVRRQSVKQLLEYAKIDEKLFLKVVDILIQLCCIDDNIVREAAHKSIETLLLLDSLKVATVAITHLEETEEASVFVAIDTLQKIFHQKLPLNSVNEEEITNFKIKLTEIIDKCINNLHMKISLDNPTNISHYNNLMISLLILLNPSSVIITFKLITPSDYVQKVISIMSIVTDHLSNVNHLLDLVKMYKLIEPYLMAEHTLVNGFMLNYVCSKLLPRLLTMKQTFTFKDSTDNQMYRILYVSFVQEIVILLTYLPASAATGCIPLFCNLLLSVLPTLDKFNPQNNSYTTDTLIDSEVLGCFLLGLYYIIYKSPTFDTTNQNLFNELRTRLGILLRVLNSGSSKCFIGSMKTIPKTTVATTTNAKSVDSTFNVNSTTTTITAAEVVDVIKPIENNSKHIQITPPSSPPASTSTRVGNNAKTTPYFKSSANRSSIHNKKSAQIYAPPYQRVSKHAPQIESKDDCLISIKLLAKALIDEPISKNVSLIPYWKLDKFLSAVRASISKCLIDCQNCRTTSCQDIFKVVESGKDTLELAVVGSSLSFQSRSTLNNHAKGGLNNFSLKRQASNNNKRGVDKISSFEQPNQNSQPAPKRATKAGRGRGRRR